MEKRVNHSSSTVNDKSYAYAPLSSDSSSERRHLRGVSDASSRIIDAICVILADLGIANEHHAIINALNALSGGRDEPFPCFHYALGRRLQRKDKYNPPSRKRSTGPAKAAQRAIHRLIIAQREAGLEISYKKYPGGGMEVEGYIFSYWSGRVRGKPGKFFLKIKQYALQVYNEARKSDRYREHKAKVIEEIAHKIAQQLKQQIVRERQSLESKKQSRSSNSKARFNAAKTHLRGFIKALLDEGKSLEEIESRVVYDLVGPEFNYAAAVLAERQHQKGAETVHQVYDKTQRGVLSDLSADIPVHPNRSEGSPSGEKTPATQSDGKRPDLRTRGNLKGTDKQTIAGVHVSSALPEIRSHVEAQIEGFASVDVERFSLRILEMYGEGKRQKRLIQEWQNLLPEEAIEFVPLVVQRCRDVVEREDRMWNAIMTPYARDGIQLLQADDIDEGMTERLDRFAFQRYHSSHSNGRSNYQVWIAVESPDPNLSYRFKRAVGSDMGATRSIRVAGSYNAKPQRKRPDGSFPVFTLDDDELGLIANLEELDEAGFILAPEQESLADLDVGSTKTTKPLPDYSYFLKRAKPRKDGSGDDISRVDYIYVKTLADRGFSFADAMKLLEDNSIIERGSYRGKYIKRTVMAAFRDAGLKVD